MTACDIATAPQFDGAPAFDFDDLDALFKSFADPTRFREWKIAHCRLAEPRNAVHRNTITCVRLCCTGVHSVDAERTAVDRVVSRAQAPR